VTREPPRLALASAPRAVDGTVRKRPAPLRLRILRRRSRCRGCGPVHNWFCPRTGREPRHRRARPGAAV